MEILRPDGYLIADDVLVDAGNSWFSPQINLPKGMAGVSFEAVVHGSGTGNFVPRAGNTRRHERGGEVVSTPSTTLDSERLPEISGISSDDLPDLTEAPKEWFINLGNCNANFVELQFKCLTGAFRITIRAAARQG